MAMIMTLGKDKSIQITSFNENITFQKSETGDRELVVSAPGTSFEDIVRDIPLYTPVGVLKICDDESVIVNTEYYTHIMSISRICFTDDGISRDKVEIKIK